MSPFIQFLDTIYNLRIFFEFYFLILKLGMRSMLYTVEYWIE